MKKLNNHPFIGSCTVCAWETAGGQYIEITDMRDLYYGMYSVSVQMMDGGLKDVYSNVSIEKCKAYVERKYK